MRPSLVTILPMFAAAVLVMVGGERMGRRDVETRTPADRERLLDLADTFRAELARLDALYHSHLQDLAVRTLHTLHTQPEEAEVEASEITGIRLIRIFRKNGKDLTISPPFSRGRLPEIELENRKRPLNPSNAVILDAALMDDALPQSGLWLPTPDPDIRLHCRQPEPGTLAVFLIDVPKVRKSTTAHLIDWLDAPLTPLLEAGERVDIQPPQGSAAVSIGPERHGPAALTLPTRTLFGDWQIRAWDGLVVSRTHDTATLTASSVIAVILAACGVLLYSQQKRALKLASERVSFVNRVSHELGSPLTNLALNLDLATEALDRSPAESRKRLGLVAEEIERLARLVANVLTFSRPERDALQLKPVRCLPGELIGRTLESFRPALARRGIVIEAEIPSSHAVSLDPDALCQITGNLISNVEKYAASGQWLKVVFEQGKDTITLEIQDRGPGIPIADRERIFTPFERVLSTTDEGSSGTGLGLSIARDLATRMGGTLELIESPEGAVFRLTLPTETS